MKTKIACYQKEPVTQMKDWLCQGRGHWGVTFELNVRETE